MAPTVGILVCGSKHEPTVRYELDGSSQPIAITSYTYDTLPPEEREALPSPEAITAALEQPEDEDTPDCDWTSGDPTRGSAAAILRPPERAESETAPKAVQEPSCGPYSDDAWPTAWRRVGV